MPIQPNYNIPPFNPESTNAGEEMANWVKRFSDQYRQDQESLTRAAQSFTTFRGDQVSNPDGSYLSKSVQLMGGENVMAFGFFNFSVAAGGAFSSAGANASAEAIGRLRVTYPNGSTQNFSAGQAARLKVTWNGTKGSQLSSGSTATMNIQSTNRAEGTVSMSWLVNPLYQFGGDHTFTLYTEGDGTLEEATLNVLVT